jgi:acetylornithine deacetylase/succinyl-diaminopimelate desuccinylase-like protein
MRRGWIIALAVVAAISAALILYNRRPDTEPQSQLWIPKPARITPEITRLQQYVRIDTSKGNEIDGARFLAAIIEQAGVHPEIIESAPGRANLVARIKGKQDGDALLLLNHIDVVPANPAEWTRPPFAAQILANMIWGRGTLDMKGIAMCQLEAFLDVARSGRVPERDIVFLATADEEHDGVMGVAWLLEHRPDVIHGVRYALNEGGITETLQEHISYFGIEIGTKMMSRVRLHAPTREALQRTRLALEPRITPPDPDRVLPEVKRYLHEIAPVRVEQRPRIDDIDRTIAQGKFWLLPIGYKELTQNVMWIGGVQQQNGDYVMGANLYLLPDEQPERYVAELQKMVAPFGVRVETVRLNGPAPFTPADTPLWTLLAREIRRQYGSDFLIGTQVNTVSYNDSRFLRARGIDAYGVWPFPIDLYQTQGIHGSDERVRADWFMDGIAVTKSIVRSWAFDALPLPTGGMTRSVTPRPQKPSESALMKPSSFG